MNASPEQRLNRISEQGLCIGCGLCESIAGPDRVRVEMTPNGYERPVIGGAISHATVDKIYKVCPGIRAEGLPRRLIDAKTQLDKVWGPYHRVVRCYASDSGVRFRGATGGVLTALAIYLLESKRIDFVLHVSASTRFPTCGIRHVSYTRDDVLHASGSRYGPAAPLVDFRSILQQGRPFAFVGKPCDIAAVRNYAEQDPRVDEHCRYFLTPVCGGFMDPKGMMRFLESLGVSYGELKGFSYRGYGCPGPTRVETMDGKVIEKNYLDFWGEDESAWTLPFRCNICPDGIGEAADIAAADTWPGGSPDREAQFGDLGTNAVITRTRAGDQLLQAAIAHGAITVERQITMRDMDRYQPHQVNKKHVVEPRHMALRRAGQLYPKTARLRTRELAIENGWKENMRQARGTKQRIQVGRNAEPTPCRGRYA